MTWIFISLLGPLLWGLGNFVDKYLVDAYASQKESSIGILILYSSLFNFLLLPIIWFFQPEVLSITLEGATVLILAGVLEIVAIFFYLYALKDEDTSIVVPFFQAIPLFGFVIGFALLGEVPTLTQCISAFVIIAGGTILSLEISEENRAKIKIRLATLMLISSFFYATYYALFKFAATDEGFWPSIFWQYAGAAITGLMLLVVRSRYRKSFTHSLRTNGILVLALNTLNEFLYAGGIVAFNFALLLAPIALVMTMYAYQPVFVFLIGITLTLFFPKVITEKITLKHLFHKSLAISIIVVASIFLTRPYWF